MQGRTRQLHRGRGGGRGGAGGRRLTHVGDGVRDEEGGNLLVALLHQRLDAVLEDCGSEKGPKCHAAQSASHRWRCRPTQPPILQANHASRLRCPCCASSTATSAHPACSPARRAGCACQAGAPGIRGLTGQAAHAAAHQHSNAGLVQAAMAVGVGTLLQARFLQSLRSATQQQWGEQWQPVHGRQRMLRPGRAAACRASRPATGPLLNRCT